MLQYIGFTSPECHLHPGEALNAPFHALDDLPPATEQCTMGAVLQEKDDEAAYLRLHQTDARWGAVIISYLMERASFSAENWLHSHF